MSDKFTAWGPRSAPVCCTWGDEVCAHQSTALVLRVGLFPCFCSSQSQIAFWGQGEGHDSVLVYVFVKEGVPTYMGRACFTSPLPGLIFGLDFCPARSKGHRLKPKWVASVNTLRTEVALVFLLCCLPLWGDIFSSDLACCFPTIFLALQIKFFLTQHFKLCSEVKGSLPLLKTKISRSVLDLLCWRVWGDVLCWVASKKIFSF